MLSVFLDMGSKHWIVLNKKKNYIIIYYGRVLEHVGWRSNIGNGYDVHVLLLVFFILHVYCSILVLFYGKFKRQRNIIKINICPVKRGLLSSLAPSLLLLLLAASRGFLFSLNNQRLQNIRWNFLRCVGRKPVFILKGVCVGRSVYIFQ